MTKQPNALRLADELDGTTKTGYWEAAAELRRLHAVNADLLEALLNLEAMAERYSPPGYPIPDAQKAARTAIAKATGQNEV